MLSSNTRIYGFIAPGIVSVFLLGMFWKGCNARGAFAMLIVSVLANIALKFWSPDLTCHSDLVCFP